MKRRKLLFLLTSIFAAVILIAGCSSDTNTSQELTAEETTGEASEATDETTDETIDEATDETTVDESTGTQSVDLVLTASNWKFDQEVYEVPVGATVQVSIVNDEGYHTANIDGYNVEVKPNETISFVADKAGEFTIACSTMCGTGHADMKSKLVVVEQ
jgi:cytochrome c oxidase subunit 2